MKQYQGEIKRGLKLIYDGTPIQWCNNKGKIVERMNKGKYEITRITDKFIFIKSDRKNATTEHCIARGHIEGNIYELEFADLTTSFGLLTVNVFLHKEWYINDKELIAKVRQHNKKGR